MNRFYHSKPINLNETIVMDDFASHHALKVMRLKNNDQLILFNGDGSDYTGQVINITKRQVEVSIKSKKNIGSESNLKVIILQALTSSDKMDLIIQKTTELGISEIQPIVCERSIVKIKKLNIVNYASFNLVINLNILLLVSFLPIKIALVTKIYLFFYWFYNINIRRNTCSLLWFCKNKYRAKFVSRRGFILSTRPS